jgi:hypothetical protein
MTAPYPLPHDTIHVVTTMHSEIGRPKADTRSPCTTTDAAARWPRRAKRSGHWAEDRVMTKLQWHPSLKKTFKGCESWWQSNMVKRDELGTELAQLQQDLDKDGRFGTRPSTIMLVAHTLTIQSCILSNAGEVGDLVSPLRHGVHFRALDFLRTATRTYTSDKATTLTSLWTSMMAVGPTMLSDWEHGHLCA